MNRIAGWLLVVKTRTLPQPGKNNTYKGKYSPYSKEESTWRYNSVSGKKLINILYG